MKGSVFTGATLISAEFENAKLKQCIFFAARITKASFGNATLSYADFRQATAHETKFNHAKLENVNFTRAQLQSADFRGAHLHFSKFSGADLSATTFQDASINNAVFKGALNLPKAEILKTKGWEHALFDQGVKQELARIQDSQRLSQNTPDL